MQSNFLTSVTAVAVSATLGVSTLATAQTALPMGGGYTNVIPIPVFCIAMSGSGLSPAHPLMKTTPGNGPAPGDLNSPGDRLDVRVVDRDRNDIRAAHRRRLRD